MKARPNRCVLAHKELYEGLHRWPWCPGKVGMPCSSHSVHLPLLNKSHPSIWMASTEALPARALTLAIVTSLQLWICMRFSLGDVSASAYRPMSIKCPRMHMSVTWGHADANSERATSKLWSLSDRIFNSFKWRPSMLRSGVHSLISSTQHQLGMCMVNVCTEAQHIIKSTGILERCKVSKTTNLCKSSSRGHNALCPNVSPSVGPQSKCNSLRLGKVTTTAWQALQLVIQFLHFR